MFWTILITILILLFVSLFIYEQIKSNRLRDEILRMNIPYVKQPSLLYVLLFHVRMELRQLEFIKQWGNVYAFDLLGGINILVADPNLIQLILSKEFTSFANRRVCEDVFFS